MLSKMFRVAVGSIPILIVAALCAVLPGTLRADVTEYSFTGTYSPYSVSISFDTTLTGTSLANLSMDDITSTVQDFSETNGISSPGSASLDVVISTDSLGNITSFSITDTQDQVVTNTTDSGGTSSTTYNIPSSLCCGYSVLSGFGGGSVESFSYDGAGYGNCSYFNGAGDFGNSMPPCPASLSSSVTTDPVSATGSGTWNSVPADPGSVTPEPASVVLYATGLIGIAFLIRKRSSISKSSVCLTSAGCR